VAAVGMVALMAMCALAVDAGSWYVAKRQLQAAADAAALAGAAELPAGTAAAYGAAAENFARNDEPGDAATYATTSKLAAGDTLKVSATRISPTFFAKVLGFDSVTIKATASATVKSYTTMASTGQLVPWAIMKDAWTLGTQYAIYTDNSSSNNGAVSLPVKDAAGNCAGTGGGDDYRTAIEGPAAGGSTACDVTVGQLLEPKRGQTAGPTKHGIDTRVPVWDPLDAVVRFTATGGVVVLKPDSPQLVMLPVVENLAGGNTWLSGGEQVRVVGFAFFVLTDPAYTDQGKTVLGRFVGLQLSNPDLPTDAFDPTRSSVFTVQLTE